MFIINGPSSLLTEHEDYTGTHLESEIMKLMFYLSINPSEIKFNVGIFGH